MIRIPPTMSSNPCGTIWSLVLAIAAVTAVLPCPGAAQDDGGADTATLSMRPFGVWVWVDTGFDTWAGWLELTESQRDSVTALAARVRAEKGDVLRTYSDLQARFRAAADERPGERRRTPEAEKQLLELMIELHPVLEGFENDIRALLNEDQAETLDRIFGPSSSGGTAGS